MRGYAMLESARVAGMEWSRSSSYDKTVEQYNNFSTPRLNDCSCNCNNFSST